MPLKPLPPSPPKNWATLSGWIALLFSITLFGLIWILPLLSLIWRAIPAWHLDLWATVQQALLLSLVTATITTILASLIGMPLAYALARYRSPLLTLLDILVDLPIVLPPAVAGVALLMTFGRNGLIGAWLAPLGVTIPFTLMAVIMAQLFVSMPFFIRAAKVGFGEVDPRLEQISATLGESEWGTFRRVTMPLARKALLSGMVMTWARALGEFGATILFAGNLPGYTQTMPLAIYTAMQTDIALALLLAVILLLTTFALLGLLRLMTHHD